MLLPFDRKKIIWGALGASLFFGILFFSYALAPLLSSGDPRDFRTFVVERGESMWNIARRLGEEGFIRSPVAFAALSVSVGESRYLQPGEYTLTPSASAKEILSLLVVGNRDKVSVRIPEGSSVYGVDKILSDKRVLAVGSFLDFVQGHERQGEYLEGKFFPDTYEFFINSTPQEVFHEFEDNFNTKALPILERSGRNIHDALIIASLIQDEVTDPHDQKLVSGVIERRRSLSMPLQIDASICYVKERVARGVASCYPITTLDFKIDSAYNTYLYKGLPPGPIGSPGITALEAALDPLGSRFLYYLSDPKTGKTYFAETFDEHLANKATYLSR